MDIGRQQRVIVVEDMTIPADGPARPDITIPAGTSTGAEVPGPGGSPPGDERTRTPRTETKGAD